MLFNLAHQLRIFLVTSLVATTLSCTHQPGQSGIEESPKIDRSATGGQATTAVDTGENPAPARLLSEAELSDGWISLFDGHSLHGWQSNVEADWKVVDGAIEVTTGEVGLLSTTTEFSDYKLKFDFRSDRDTNSGVFLRTAAEPKDPTKDCYEWNIAGGDNPFPTGSLVGRKKVDGDFSGADWQTWEVTVLGPQITVQRNQETILEYTDPQPLRRGRIGLQHNRGKVRFRNICLKPLGMNRIFNGEDLSGWTVRPGMESEFSVTPAGHMKVIGGRGQIETEGQYGDFVLQLECMTHGKYLNSGVFFRCIPGDVMMGYESQIHNGFENDDRNRPTDCGTGGIFRRQNARRIMADDFTWFHKTLVAHKAHIAVWVNGYQVSDWTDTRPPHENPRKGLRLAPGTVIIQGHDPTTNLSFRQLRITALPPND